MASELAADVVSVARRLLGCNFERELDGHVTRVRIVETEAYDQTDAASHSYKGKTPRTDIMFGPADHLYVYFTYGMHYCMNVVVGEEGYGAAVLIRAVEPIEGEEILARRRPGRHGIELTNGPAKLCQALGVDKAMNGHDLERLPLRLVMKPPLPGNKIITTERIGISQAKDMPWRFYIKDNPYVSGKSKAQQ
ncbi:DNA-3-methyladenine glycosylase [Streptomyces caniscabiei]|uniref:DNA-3-methyladenine glycosylase n=1 Tax=Streptomyces caniscabiei TaxID=2746961 RepID=UPI0029B76167|nr:DNA-3-methyladenine glycosylase [Streptomyces caniscabiei]MDX2775882.1 DNA-3-methyladenine glycosylase [Streptomyces caniscabiei]